MNECNLSQYISKAEMIAKLKSIDFDSLPLESLNAIHDIVFYEKCEVELPKRNVVCSDCKFYVETATKGLGKCQHSYWKDMYNNKAYFTFKGDNDGCKHYDIRPHLGYANPVYVFIPKDATCKTCYHRNESKHFKGDLNSVTVVNTIPFCYAHHSLIQWIDAACSHWCNRLDIT